MKNPESPAAIGRTIDRGLLTAAMGEALAEQPWALAAWLGGSDATGRCDRFSDIDLVCIVEDDAVERTFETVRDGLVRLSPIDMEWRVPGPAWHGHEQVFWRLRDVDPHLIIDVVVIKASSLPAQRFLEPERHGRPRVLFDRGGWVAAVPMDASAHEAKLRARLDRLRVTFPMFQPLVTRAIERGQPCDAAYFYTQLTLLPTVEVLRMRHCSERFDFGMRYLRDDLPADVYERVCRLALPGTLEGIRSCRADAERLFMQASDALGQRS